MAVLASLVEATLYRGADRDDVVRVLNYLGDTLEEHGHAKLVKMQSLNFVEPDT